MEKEDTVFGGYGEKEKPLLLYVLLNPSHADADTDDKTVIKLIKFTRNWGYGGFYLGNIHSFITSNPKRLMQNLIPNERLNITHLKEMVKNSDKVVLGWGNAGKNPKWLKQNYKLSILFWDQSKWLTKTSALFIIQYNIKSL